jgi:quinoprotein glucose dehydrogenase
MRQSICGRAMLGVMAGLTIHAAGAQQNRKSWSEYGGGPDNSHHLTLTQINKSNVGQLQVAWSYPTQDNNSYVFNPLVVDNVMYVMARNTSLVAIDATTGKEIWVHENLNGIAQRGINYWESKDRKDRRLIFQIHQQLQEIDARTGLSITNFGTNGFVDLREGLGRDLSTIYRIQSGTPGKVFENLIILGSATGENFISPPGDLRAYDVITGKMAWIFHTVPHPGELGYDTWPKDAWKYMGGVNTWGELSVDEKRGIAYFPLGSGTYDFYGADRTGANLFADCLLALDARTGKYKWHFQEVHHDLWDYDAVSAPQLITVKHNGKTVDAVAHAGKTSFLYVLDRVTGEPLWPIEERPVPKSDMPGEHAWPTQPFPTKPPAFGRQKFTADDINPFLPEEQRATLKDRVLSARNEGIYTPPGFRDTISMPGNRGGSNWGTTAANPDTGVVYVLSIDAPAILKMAAEQPVIIFAGRGAGAGASPGQELYQRNCQACHGANRAGVGQIPSLIGVTSRMGADVIRTTILNGAGQMPGFGNLSDSDLNQLFAFLAGAEAGGRGGRGGRGMAAPARSAGGPVVASGGAPAGQLAPGAKLAGVNPHGIMDGPPYPEGIDAPKERYFTDWNVMYNIVSPPWNNLTAYDLNQGTIKWQVAVGDDPGIMLEQRGIISTSAGLLFLAAGDGKVRALDDETGKTLWTGSLPAGARSIPVLYEANGVEYLVVSATSPLGGGRGNAAAAPAQFGAGPATLKRAYVAFALPKKGGNR